MIIMSYKIHRGGSLRFLPINRYMILNFVFYFTSVPFSLDDYYISY